MRPFSKAETKETALIKKINVLSIAAPAIIRPIIRRFGKPSFSIRKAGGDTVLVSFGQRITVGPIIGRAVEISTVAIEKFYPSEDEGYNAVQEHMNQ